MPKKAVDYSRNVIYKLVCNDENIADCYVGHTTDFTKRKSNHKSISMDCKHKSYNSGLYQFIRNNGGFINWTMVEIEKYPCKDAIEACSRERHYIEVLQASLNKNRPVVTSEERLISDREYCRKYFMNNKEYFRNYHKTHYEDKKEQMKEYQRIYRQQNKDKLSERHSCPCGGSYTPSNKYTHNKTKRHSNYVNSLPETNGN